MSKQTVNLLWEKMMRTMTLLPLRMGLGILLTVMPLMIHADTIGSVNYRFKWLGPSDKIAVEAFDDPSVAGVTCYLSRAETGGLKGMVGLAENPSKASIACRQIGPIEGGVLDRLKDEEEVFSARASAIFKSTQVIRFVDRQRGALVYLTYTDRIVDGSPDNSISVVPVRATTP
jgi:CreA protein